MKKKVLIIASWYPTMDSPAIGTFCKDQAELVRDCFDIRVIYPKLRLISKRSTLKRFYYPNTCTIKHNLVGPIEGVEIEGGVSTFLSKKRQIGFLTKNCYKYLVSWQNEGWSPDIIHAHGTLDAGLIAFNLSTQINVPYIITEHHSLLIANFDKENWALYKQAQESSNLLLVVSNELKKMILMNGVNCNVEVVGNLLDEEVFTFVNESKRNKVFKLLFIAVPSLTKDIPTFILSLKNIKLAGHKFEAQLIIPDIAADLSKQQILNLCTENGVSDNCIFSGSVKHEEIPSIIQSADALVSTSITETFGLSVAEAVLSGKPVVVTRSGGVEDFVNSKNGVVINIGDHEAISNAIVQLMCGEIQFDSVASREEIINRFGKVAFKKRISEKYNLLMNDQRN